MRKLILGFLLATISITSVSAAYPTQWFVSFIEWQTANSFKCEKQCIVLVWDMTWNDYIEFKWNLSWEGNIWYWFAVWQQVAPGEFIQVKWSTPANRKFIFSKNPVFNQLPKETKIMIVIDWKIDSTDFVFGLWTLTLWESISSAWNEFWKIETLTPYSINLRYWTKIFWVPIIKFFYFTFIFLLLILIPLINQNQKKIATIYLFLSIFIFISIRNLITEFSILNKWLWDYTYNQWVNKHFFDLWDYIEFTKLIREKLNLDSNPPKDCKIYISSVSDWPFKTHWQNVYLAPCKLVENQNNSDYSIFFHTIKTWSWNIIIDFNWNYLTKTK